MPKPSTRRRNRIGLTATATLLSLNVNANDHDIRIGRYQTVSVEAPLQEIEAKPPLQAMEIPKGVETRGEALQWILQQHGYRLHADSERLLIAAEALAAALLPEERQRPAGSLRLALRSLLGNRVQLMVDSGTKQVFVSIDAQANEVLGARDVSE